MSDLNISNEINERIKFIQQYYGLKQSEFADKIGVTPGAINKIIKEVSRPSGDLLLAILREFPEVSAEWLMRGNGVIKISYSQEQQGNKPLDPTITQSQYDALEKKIAKIQRDIRKLEEDK